MGSKKEQIFEHIQTYPGKTLSEITNDLQLSATTVRFHLGKLKQDNFIIISKIDKTRYFISDIDYKTQIKISVENNPYLSQILEVLNGVNTLDDVFYKTKISKNILTCQPKPKSLKN